MNIYGDMGNIIALSKRCQWRGINVEYVSVNSSEEFSLMESGDLYFFGGGQDADQMRVWDEIKSEQEKFTQLVQTAVNEDKVFLLVCGGYQMFGKYFVDAQGRSIPGVGILDIETVAPGDSVASRCIGNIAINTNIDIEPQTIVGFENHGGQTKFVAGSAQQLVPFGRVIRGHGNRYRSAEEGCMYRNVIGSYLHGSLLPKNPHLADHLITRALSVKYEEDISLPPIDDSLEWSAHRAVLGRILV